MELLYKNEHLKCVNYDHSLKPGIECLNLRQGKKDILPLELSKIVFCIEGNLSLNADNRSVCEINKGEIIFLQAGDSFSYMALSDCVILIFRLSNPLMLCQSLSLEKLHSCKASFTSKVHGIEAKKTNIIQMNPRIWYLVNGIRDFVHDQVKCKHYFDLKIKEFLLALRAYYTKKEIYHFFSPVISNDIFFTEHIRLHHTKCKTVKQLADSLNMSVKQFSVKFNSIFGKAPYRWMLDEKTKNIKRDVIGTTKPFKQIAIENGFTTAEQFTKFCKLKLGKTPSLIRQNK